MHIAHVQTNKIRNREAFFVWFLCNCVNGLQTDINTEGPVYADDCLENVTIPNTPINSFGIIECSNTSIAFETFSDSACTTTAMGTYTIGTTQPCQNFAHYSMRLQC